MPYRPKNPQAQDPEPETASTEPEEKPTGLKAISKQRKSIWIIGLAVALYMIVTGLWQAFFATQG